MPTAVCMMHLNSEGEGSQRHARGEESHLQQSFERRCVAGADEAHRAGWASSVQLAALARMESREVARATSPYPALGIFDGTLPPLSGKASRPEIEAGPRGHNWCRPHLYRFIYIPFDGRYGALRGPGTPASSLARTPALACSTHASLALSLRPTLTR